MKPIDYVLIIGMTALVLGIIVYLVLNKKKGRGRDLFADGEVWVFVWKVGIALVIVDQ